MRARWILTPGNDLFLVVTQNWQNPGDGLFDRDREFITLSRGASVKLNYTYRLWGPIEEVGEPRQERRPACGGYPPARSWGASIGGAVPRPGRRGRHAAR